MRLAQAPLGQLDEPQALEVAPGEGERERPRRPGTPPVASSSSSAPSSAISAATSSRGGSGSARSSGRARRGGGAAAATRRSGTPSGTRSEPIRSGFVSWSGVARPGLPVRVEARQRAEERLACPPAIAWSASGRR